MARVAALGRDVADEAARERVARAGGVDDLLERIRRQREDVLLGEERRAVLALLGDDRLEAPPEQLLRGGDGGRPRR